MKTICILTCCLIYSLYLIGCSDSTTTPITNTQTGFTFDASFNANPGEMYTFRLIDTNSITGPGNSGNNVTWDFSGINILVDSNTNYYLTPSSTPYSASFPTATVAFQQGIAGALYIYYRNSSALNEQIGFASPAFTLPYSDVQVFQFPLNYQGTNQDTYRGNYSIGPVTHEYYGNVSWNYDGVGTLILPNGITYTNVARVHRVDTFTDSAMTVNVSTEDGYQWYRSDYKFPIFNYMNVTVNSVTRRFAWINRNVMP